MAEGKTREIKPAALVAFVFEMIDAYSTFLVKLGEAEKRHGIALHELNEVLGGERFRPIADAFDTAKLGSFVKAVAELGEAFANVDVNNLPTDKKIELGKKLRSIFEKYEDLVVSRRKT